MTASRHEGAPPAGASEGRTDRWVALMFHDVLPETRASGGGAERFAVPSGAFALALDTISATGRRGCSLAEALTSPGTRRVAITFDDGTRSQFDHALPALLERGMTATFFVTTDWVGRPGYMSWGELRHLVECGMSVQSHSRSHPFLSECDAEQLRRELAGSKAVLDDELGQVTEQIGLPGGDAPARRHRELLGRAGYRVVASSRWGVNRDAGDVAGDVRWIRRCTVRRDVDPHWLERVYAGDRGLAARRVPREALLGWLRAALGPSRYARLRRRALDALD